ncbi:unnamed protein product [Closterium sp. Naga37s-1]|nr:unnamed protein product [Closterium sp. Naga37s-1]
MSRVRLRSAWSRAASTLLFRDSSAWKSSIELAISTHPSSCIASSRNIGSAWLIPQRISRTRIVTPVHDRYRRFASGVDGTGFDGGQGATRDRGDGASAIGGEPKDGSTARTAAAAIGRDETDGVLVRDFIHTSLYHPTDGYFTSNAAAVGSIPHPISFRQLAGRREWMALQQSLYASADTSWFTPSELFQPWYGYAVADFILSSHSPTKPLKMYEVGGGGGTLARNILDRLQAKAPAVYRHCRYTSVEISPALARRQRERITGYALKHGNAGDSTASTATHTSAVSASTPATPATPATPLSAATAAPDSGSQDGAALSVGRARRGAKGARDSSASRAALNGAARCSPSHESVHSVAVFDAADVRGWGEWWSGVHVRGEWWSGVHVRVGGREEGGVYRGSEGRVGEEMGDREGRGVSGVGALVHVFGTARTKRCSVFGIRWGRREVGRGWMD